MDLLAYLIISTATACWRILYLGLIIPAWRLGWKGLGLVAAAVLFWKLEQEAEAGAYHN